jgi:hypothetical protein
VLRAAGVGVAATVWPGLTARATPAAPARADAVVLLWLAGGVTHLALVPEGQPIPGVLS